MRHNCSNSFIDTSRALPSARASSGEHQESISPSSSSEDFLPPTHPMLLAAMTLGVTGNCDPSSSPRSPIAIRTVRTRDGMPRSFSTQNTWIPPSGSGLALRKRCSVDEPMQDGAGLGMGTLGMHIPGGGGAGGAGAASTGSLALAGAGLGSSSMQCLSMAAANGSWANISSWNPSRSLSQCHGFPDAEGEDYGGQASKWSIAAPSARRSIGAAPSRLSEGSGLAYSFQRATAAQNASQAGPAGPKSLDVYVMLPLDSVVVVQGGAGDAVSDTSVVRREAALRAGLDSLRAAGVQGAHLDLWWGIAERSGPRCYDFSAFRRVILLCRDAGLRVQIMASFHAAGGNVGDSDCVIPLPKWILDAARRDPDLLYTDKSGRRNAECLSLGCDHVPIDDCGRTPPQIYAEFIAAFVAGNRDLVEAGVIAEVTVGMGPAGELRYPSYPALMWQFPGVGEFQAYDRYLAADLAYHASSRGHPDWSLPPSDAGSYNARPDDTPFFKAEGGGWSSEYGRFFLGWYGGALVGHLERVLGATRKALASLPHGLSPPPLSVKLAGVHWLYGHKSHAAEVTAGYVNCEGADGYSSILRSLATHGASLSFTAVEMRDKEHPHDALARPQLLVQQILAQASLAAVPVSGENALPRFDPEGLGHMAATLPDKIHRLTFLRMSDDMFEARSWRAFRSFVERVAPPTSPLASPQPHSAPSPPAAAAPSPPAAAAPHFLPPTPSRFSRASIGTLLCDVPEGGGHFGSGSGGAAGAAASPALTPQGSGEVAAAALEEGQGHDPSVSALKRSSGAVSDLSDASAAAALSNMSMSDRASPAPPGPYSPSATAATAAFALPPPTSPAAAAAANAAKASIATLGVAAVFGGQWLAGGGGWPRRARRSEGRPFPGSSEGAPPQGGRDPESSPYY